MRTALDSSVLLDVLGADSEYGEASREALRSVHDEGALIACDVVWAEVRAHFPDDEPFREAMELLGVRFDPLPPEEPNSPALCGATGGGELESWAAPES